MTRTCPGCGGASFGTFTVNGVTHRDPLCAHAATTGGSTDGLSRCERCGTVGQHDNGHCDACQWWA